MGLGVTRENRAIALVLLLATGVSAGAQTTVTVVDRNDAPVPDAVVYLEGAGGSGPASQQIAVIDQIDKRFVPHITVVTTGTEISFPNNDSVSHHVYSFSRANRFELPLYKGETRPSIRFDNPGLVTLGCNIHDSMLAYIMVVESAVHGITDAAGTVIFERIAANGTWRVWSPRLRPSEIAAPATVASDAAGNITLKLATEQRNTTKSTSGSLSWDEY